MTTPADPTDARRAPTPLGQADLLGRPLRPAVIDRIRRVLAGPTPKPGTGDRTAPS